MRMMISQSHPQAGSQRAPSSRPLLLSALLAAPDLYHNPKRLNVIVKKKCFYTTAEFPVITRQSTAARSWSPAKAALWAAEPANQPRATTPSCKYKIVRAAASEPTHMEREEKIQTTQNKN